MNTTEKNTINIGLDIGSVSAKCIINTNSNSLTFLTDHLKKHEWSVEKYNDFNFLLSPVYPILGDALKAALKILSPVLDVIPADSILNLQITGVHGKYIARIVEAPFINEFKAIARGTAFLVPDAQTIFEIGGDGSRYMHIKNDPETRQVSILDYERNGDCAAGTGSFIDQQAARLNFQVKDIGPMVIKADSAANIAGRCSVFAKSDMVHAQQRGFSPASIFKGLCEAVVRNYKGTVLRGKTLVPKIAFVGGLAANQGVVKAMYKTLNLGLDELHIPQAHAYAGAFGCVLNDNDITITKDQLLKLSQPIAISIQKSKSKKLETEKVQIISPVNPEHYSIFPINAYLGLDIGSVSTNLVLIDTKGHVIDEIYTRTEGQPIKVIQREFNIWNKKWGDKIKILGVGSTGSGRELIGELTGADVIHDEITAHKTGSAFIAKTMLNDTVDTIFEIGGQDSKFISIQDDIVIDFTMNEACAAGTGSFLEEQALKMGISIKEEFSNLALQSETPIQMGERCTVFMEKDVTSFLQQGVLKKDIAAGLAFAVVQNYLNRVVRERHIGDKIFFQGGTAYNKSVAAAFAMTLNKKIIVPPHNGVMGALGVALLAKEKQNSYKKTRFRGFDLSKINFSIRNISCKACSNQCDVQECTIEGEKTYWGDKCSERFRKKRKVSNKAVIPDLIELYHQQLTRNIPGPDGLGLKIGFPRAMYFYDRFPFWKAYFSQLGAEIILSEPTNKNIVTLGRELCIAEPCFPILAGHGHYQDLVNKNVDYIFIPNVINSETEITETESWFCPWGQTLPLVLKNTVKDNKAREQILAPVIRFRDGKQSVKEALYKMAKPFGISHKRNDQAVEFAYAAQEQFKNTIKQAGQNALKLLSDSNEKGIVILGRPYNIYDSGLNLNVPTKLRENYGINIIPMDFLPFENIPVSHIHENMFWNYGKKILQTSIYAGRHNNLDLVYFTNFKCGPDSYVKHFVSRASCSPFLVLQFDDHSNDAGIMTRCEAYLESKNIITSQTVQKVQPIKE